MVPLFGVRLMPLYEASGGGGGAGSGDPAGSAPAAGSGDGQGSGSVPDTLEAWIDAMPEAQKAVGSQLMQARFEKLENTVRDTRDERDRLSGQLRDLAKKAAKDPDLQKQLDELAGKYDEAARRADFLEEAPAQQCRNPKVAYALMVSSNLVTRAGKPDWKAIKEAAPELFGPVVQPRGNAGSGTGAPAAGGGSINDWIRRQAGGGD